MHNQNKQQIFLVHVMHTNRIYKQITHKLKLF